MADKSIDQLVAADVILATDLFVLQQSGIAKKLTGQVLLNWLTAAADGHGGIQSIKKVNTSGLVDTYRITLADTTPFDFFVTNGRDVVSITKTSTSGLVDTYTIRYNDGNTETLTVTNGAKGDKGDNAYIWIKFASQQPTASSNSFGDVPDDWIGIYFGGLAEAPTDWQQYIWYKIKGEKGDTGEPAVLVSSSVEYQVSDSGTIIPSGSWSFSVPVVPQGRYLWTRTTKTFNTGSPVVSYSVSRMGLDGSGSVSSVANISPGEDGNVPLTAADVGALPSTGGDLTGALRMNGQPISGLNAPITNDQAANMEFVNQQVRKAAPRNLLDNSDFTNPVNQRGAMSYDGAKYTIDRWKAASGYGIVTVGKEFVNLKSNTDDTAAYFQQYIESGKIKSGKKYTVACTLADGSVHCISGTASPDLTDSDMRQTLYVNNVNLGNIRFKYEKTTSLYVVIFSTSTTRGIDVANVALYEGEYTAETLPEYQPKGYDVELLTCKRYFGVVTIGYAPSGYGYGNGQSQVKITVSYPTTFSINPSIHFSDGKTVSDIRLAGGGKELTPTNVVTNSMENGVAFTFTVTGATNLEAYLMRATSGFKIFLSADL